MSIRRTVPSLLIVAVAFVGPIRGADDSAEVVRRYPMNPYHANIGRIESVSKDGTLRVVDLANPRLSRAPVANLPDLVEGTYLAFVGSDFTASTEDTRLVKVNVVEVGEKSTATLSVSAKAAAGIEKGEQIVLFRPPGSTTKEVAACPEYAKVDDGRGTTVFGDRKVHSAATLSVSRSNLKQIGIAIHNFHDTHGCMPPAVIYGPDGKPWHSWRVLLLPYIEQSNLYERYRWDEPWDGPNNKKLIAIMPSVYGDPVHGENRENYTHYAAATGPSAAFTTKGVSIEKGDDGPFRNLNRRSEGILGFRDFTDGLSNTLMIASVGPERKIPWTKPEDVVFEKEFPRPGEKGSFAAPFESRRGKGAVVLICDGSVRTVRTDVDAESWQHLVERNDGFPVEVDDTPGLDSPIRTRSGARAMQFVEIVREGDEVRARLVTGEAD